jgi:hypothetical protein
MFVLQSREDGAIGYGTNPECQGFPNQKRTRIGKQAPIRVAGKNILSELLAGNVR